MDPLTLSQLLQDVPATPAGRPRRRRHRHRLPLRHGAAGRCLLLRPAASRTTATTSPPTPSRAARRRSSSSVPLDVDVPAVRRRRHAGRARAWRRRAFYGEPSRALDVVGITGTNGKTTTTYLLDAILRAAGRTTGLIGTVETRVADERLPAARTTPESADLQALLARDARRGRRRACRWRSRRHAIDLHRVDARALRGRRRSRTSRRTTSTTTTRWRSTASVKRRLFTDVRRRRARRQHRRPVRRGAGRETSARRDGRAARRRPRVRADGRGARPDGDRVHARRRRTGDARRAASRWRAPTT